MGRIQTVFIGDTFTIKGQQAVVTSYVNSLRIGIRFEDGFETFSRSSRIKSGNIRNPLKKTIAGVGYTGIGDCPARADNKTYMVWTNMLNRCYSPKTQILTPTYIGCSVAEEWHDFQVFAKWYESIFTGVFVNWELDKDIMNKGNKVYSPETCTPMPSELNCLLIKSEKTRGKECVGVSWHSRDHMFQANCNVNNKSVHLGYHETEISAFIAYKDFKESYIKKQAAKWQSQIDPRAYEALMAYEVLITD